MKISEIKDLKYKDIQKMNYSELSDIVSAGIKYLNPRINRLYRHENEIAYARDVLDFVEESGGLINKVSGYDTKVAKTYQELKDEAFRVRKLLGMEKRLTVKGAKELSAQRRDFLQKALEKKYRPEDIDSWTAQQLKEKISKEWEEFQKWRERHPGYKDSDDAMTAYLEEDEEETPDNVDDERERIAYNENEALQNALREAELDNLWESLGIY